METKILYPSRLRLLFVPLFGLAGIALCVFLISYVPRNKFFPLQLCQAAGWFGLFCSILWVVGGLINFLHSACFLRLNDEGLTAAWLFLAFSLKWENVKVFRTYQQPSKPFGISFKNVVADVFDVAEIEYSHRFYGGLIMYTRGREAYASFMRTKFGCDAALVANYGLSAEGLADLLNEWSEHKASGTAERQG
jgi:hypothetical protein